MLDRWISGSAALVGAICLCLAYSSPASAQFYVVASCPGSSPTYQVGTQAIPMMDVHGTLCTAATGGGGGPVTIADGADVAKGATTDAACAGDNTSGCSEESRLQRIAQRLTTINTTLGTLAPAGATSNASSAVATSATNSAAVAYLYGFDGTTWDQLQVDAAKNLKVAPVGVAQGSTTSGQTELPIGCRTLTSAPTDTTAQTNIPWCRTSGALALDSYSWAGTALGAPSNFGTSPTAVAVPGVNSSLFVGTTVADGNSGSKSNGTQRVVLATDQPALTNPLLVTLSGTQATTPVQGATNITPTDCSGTITSGGTAQNAHTAQSTLRGMTIANIDTTEVLWISFTGTAAASGTGSFPLAPATATTFASLSSYTTPVGFGYNTALSVFGLTTSHKFTCTRW